ncbi:Tar (HIV-1) RNA binding protein 1, partial [Rhizophlyctis rosea]
MGSLPPQNAYASLRKVDSSGPQPVSQRKLLTCTIPQVISQEEYSRIVDALYVKLKTTPAAAWLETDLKALVDALQAEFEFGTDVQAKQAQAERFLVDIVEYALGPRVASGDGVLASENVDRIVITASVIFAFSSGPATITTFLTHLLPTLLTPFLYPTCLSSLDLRSDESFFTSLNPDHLIQSSDIHTHFPPIPRILRLNPCLDLLKLIIKRLSDHDIDFNDDQLTTTVESMFKPIVALLSLGDSTVRSKIGNEVIPGFLRWDGGRRRRMEWCRLIWNHFMNARTKLGLDHRVTKEVPGFLCRLFDSYFGLDEAGRFEVGRVGLDLRKEEGLFEIIQHGLCGGDPIAAKYSVFLLKRIVDFSRKYEARLGDDGKQWSRQFYWSTNPQTSKALSALWDEFHLLYDTADESFVHLVEPIIPKLTTFLLPRQIGTEIIQVHPSWWCVVINRGINNTAHAIRRRIFEYVVGIEDVNVLRMVGGEWEFLFERFFPGIQESALFSVPGLGNFVSGFGEGVRGFVRRVIKAFDRVEDQERFIRTLARVIRTFKVPMGVLYLMQGLYDLALDPEMQKITPWGREEIGYVRSLLEGEYAVTVWSKLGARKLLRKYMIEVFLRFGDLSGFGFDDFTRLVQTLLAEGSEDTAVYDMGRLREWAGRAFPVQDGDVPWLADNTKTTVSTYVNDGHGPTWTDAPASAIAQMIMLLYTSGDGNGEVRYAIETVVRRLEDLRNPYAPEGAGERACLVLVGVLENVGRAGGMKGVIALLPSSAQYQSGIVEYLEELAFSSRGTETIDIVVRAYRSLIVSPATLVTYGSMSRACVDVYVRVAKRALDILQDLAKESTYPYQCAKYGALRMLSVAVDGACQRGVGGFLTDEREVVELVLDRVRFRKSRGFDEGQVNWSELQNLFTEAQYDCVRAIAQASRTPDNPGFTSGVAHMVFERCVDELESATHATGEGIMILMRHLLGMEWEKDADLMGRAIRNALPVLEENWTNSKYFPGLYDAFVGFAFQPGTLGVEDLFVEGSGLREAFHKILSWAEQRVGLVPKLGQACYDFWVNAVMQDADPVVSRLAVKSLRAYVPELVEMLLFGPVMEINKDDHKFDAVIALKLREGKLSSAEIEELQGTAQWNFSLKDYTVRVRALDIISRLSRGVPEHCEIALAILDVLLERHLGKMYFAKFMNSGPHRKQIRLWTAIHILIPFIPPQRAHHYTNLLMQCIELEMQISTRYYIDWALIRVLVTSEDCIGLVQGRLEEFDLKAHVISSFVTVLHHVGGKVKGRREFYETLLGSLVPWTSSNHFTIRLFAQYALWSGWKRCLENAELTPILETVPQITAAARFIAENVECARHREKCEKAYFLGGGFDPMDDVNLEFLLRGCLAVSGVSEDERVSAMAFEKVNPRPGRQIKLKNDGKGRDAWAEDSAIKLSNIISGKDHVSDETATSGPSPPIDAPIQKKIVPWEAMMETDIDLSREREDRHKKARNPLIVVASLIGKAPNLGGLCRTCEIFSAELLVLGSLKVTEDAAFQGTAVTADKWMPMLEVREPDVEEYLLAKKAEGYALLGIEQATRSVSLETFTFPEKSLLLLGKEKEGIPVHLLPLLDYVLEIPQFGVIR